MNGLAPGLVIGPTPRPTPRPAANLAAVPAALPLNFPASIIAGSEPDEPERRRPWALSLAVGLIAGLALGAGLVRLAGAAPPWSAGAPEEATEAALDPAALGAVAEVEATAAAVPEVVEEAEAAAVPAAPDVAAEVEVARATVPRAVEEAEVAAAPAAPPIAPSVTVAETAPASPSVASSPEVSEASPAVEPDAPPGLALLAPPRGGPGPVPVQADRRSAPRGPGSLAAPQGEDGPADAIELLAAGAVAPVEAGLTGPEPLPEPPAGEALRLAVAEGQPGPVLARLGPALAALIPDDPLAPPPGPPVARVPTPEVGAEPRVALHLPPALSPDALRAAETALGEAGYDLAGTSIAGFGVTESEVRFFHPEDAAEAARIAAAMGATARDFSAYRPAPAPGTLDVWLAQDG